MTRCAACEAIAVGVIALTLTVRPVWDWTAAQTERHEVGLCAECIGKLADGREVAAELLEEFAP